MLLKISFAKFLETSRTIEWPNNARNGMFMTRLIICPMIDIEEARKAAEEEDNSLREIFALLDRGLGCIF